MLTVKELYDFLHEHGIDDNSICILHRDPDCDNVHWIDYNEDKQKAIEKYGCQEVGATDIYVKD